MSSDTKVDPFRPSTQQAFVDGYGVTIYMHLDGGWTFNIWEPGAPDSEWERVASGAADSESSVKMLALRVASECAARRDGRERDIQTLPPFLDHKSTEGGFDVE